jgi:hypothetical protein
MAPGSPTLHHDAIDARKYTENMDYSVKARQEKLDRKIEKALAF